MLTVDQIAQYLEHTIAQDRLAGDREALRRSQLAAGVIMHAADQAGDKQTAMRFRVLAAQAANKQEEISGEDE